MTREKRSGSLEYQTLVALNIKFQELARGFVRLCPPGVQGRHRHAYPSGSQDFTSCVRELRLTKRVPSTRRTGNFVTVQVELRLAVCQAKLIGVDVTFFEIIQGHIREQI